MSKPVKIVYNGPADRLYQAGPSGKVYEFERGTAVEIDKKDAVWFLGEPMVSPSFDEPAPSPEPAAPDVGTFSEPVEAEVAPEAPAGDFSEPEDNP